MARRVLVTGSPDRVAALGRLFADAGVEPVTPAEWGAGAVTIDHYVQLGVTVSARGDTVVRRVRSFLDDGLLDRFTSVERVLPMLADDAVVLLVAGNMPAEVAAPDDRAARLSLLRVLAHAIRADLAPRRVRVRVITGGRTDAEIAGFALTGDKDTRAEAAQPVTTGPDAERTYEDWRIQMLGLVRLEV